MMYARPFGGAGSSSRRGAIAVMMALVLLVVMGFAALVIDMGYARLVQAQLQATADAAAMAGAARLDQTADGLTDARDTAVAVAALNKVRGSAVTLDGNSGNLSGGGVVTGIWDGTTFTPSLEAEDVNAVQVNLADDSMTAMFSRVAWDNETLQAAATSTALQGLELSAGGVSWYLPFGIADCQFETWEGEELVDMTFRLNPDGADNTGWTAIGATPSAAWASDHLEASLICMQDWYATGEVSSECPTGEASTTASTSNGEIADGLHTIDQLIESSNIPWDSSVWGTLPAQNLKSSIAKPKYGNVIFGPFPVIDASDDYCSSAGGKWNESFEVVGFVWGAIYDVKTTGSPKNIWVRIDPTSEYDVGTHWGGGDYGVVTTGPPTVVQ